MPFSAVAPLQEPETTAAMRSSSENWARWSIIASIWLVTLTTFSMAGRTPDGGESFDAIALLKLVGRATMLGVSMLVLANHWSEPQTRAAIRQLFPFFLFVAWSIATVAWSPMKSFSLSQASCLLSLVLLSAAIGSCWRGSRYTSQYLLHVSGAMLIYSAIVVAVAVIDFDASGMNHRAGVRGIVHPTAAGATASLGILIVVASRFLWGWKWTRSLLTPAILVHGSLLILSSSRAAIIMTASLGLAAWLAFNSRRVLGGALLAASAAGTAYVLMDPGIEGIEYVGGTSLAYLQRGQSAEDIATVSGRAEIWQLIWNSFLESPIFGQGYFMCSSTGLLDVWGDTTRETAHNLLLQVLVSTGLIGALLFAWAICRVGASVRNNLYGAPPQRRAASLACLLGCWYLGWGIGCESFLGPVQPESVVFFVMVGIVVATNSPLANREPNLGPRFMDA